MNKLAPGETLYLDLGNGRFQAISYEAILKKTKGKKVSAKQGILRRIRLYKYAEKNGKYVSGQATTVPSLAKSKEKLIDRILNQPKEMQEELLNLI